MAGVGVLLCLAIAAGLGGCDLPRDPEGTTERVRNHVLRVGVVHEPPWVIADSDDGEFSGVEVDLVTQLANDLGAEIEWFPGSEASLMESLCEFELDLVIGGITDKSPWRKHVGFTRPYYETRLTVGASSGEPLPEDVDGLEVAARPGRPEAALARDRGAPIVYVDDLHATDLPIAAEHWRIVALDRTAGDVTLKKLSHAMATPPGENGWLLLVDKFLQSRRPRVEKLLVEYVADAQD